ncbi:hypothetical protein J4856_08140 [Prevotella scopos JCM 17725]|jgi:hypothetical protein|uniref:Uncharacterized protein n=1 Tax=Prevotella scopos JCM 17725 TaxID=1236518 RepID=A0AAX2F672_9BACT|nr:hypothetical protein [Prevotella scopos]ANR73008.1 hypothetical protein AXF22_06195 [Prevotella scopos JCM 17725]QUB46096.1 hypothetical protein J4856_08140 [Prevotella scopos JCM 17725]SHG03117.1 hypothetical protein SAMN05444364_12814 [Prevotella scopos JCM 17725]
MKDLEEHYVTVLDDFQHTVENKIRNHKNDAGFPQLPANISEDDLADYLFDYQAALDSEGTERSRYTIAGFLLCLPILIMSAFPDDSLPFEGIMNVLAAIGVGLILFFLYRVIMKIVVKKKIRQANQDYPEVKNYVDHVMAFK